jgi:16S rRNA (cytosine967-C5)-methyltransferase
MSGPVSPARIAAFDILQRVESDNAFASVLLSDDNLNLTAQDRSLTYELVMGVLRRRMWLDAVVEHFAGRPLRKIDPPVLQALRLGLYQLRFLDRIPDSAAVNESVNLIHRARLRSATGLVNAVLRRALREPHFDPAAQVADPIEKLSIEASHPIWLLARWRELIGLEQTRALALANNENPVAAFRLTTRVKDRDVFLAVLREQGVEFTDSPITRCAWRVRAGAPQLQEYAQKGLVYFQDEASQWVANVAGADFGPLATKRPLLDVCAAPGSKSTQMAARLAPNGSVIAGDRHEHRLRTVRSSAMRQEIPNLELVAHDAEVALPFPDAAFYTVLVDAPCSGTGTLRRNPEIRYRISSSDLTELAQKQGRILANAARTVRPGGLLFYSTCSIEIDENEAVIAAFLATQSDFRVTDIGELSAEAPLNPEILPESAGFARFWPQKHNTEGFFAAALHRRLDV